MRCCTAPAATIGCSKLDRPQRTPSLGPFLCPRLNLLCFGKSILTTNSGTRESILVPSPPRLRHLSVTESAARSRLKSGGHHMPLSHIRPEPSLLPIERPPCPKCQGHMMLATIEPGPGAGSDQLTFKCRKCEHVHKMLVGDPMKSAGWQHSGLKAPV